MQPQPAAERDAFAAALTHFTTTCDWLRDDAMALAHGAIETHVLLASREIARRMLQAHFDLRARREREAPRPPEVAPEAVPRAQSCNLDTVVGRVRVTRWAWQATGAPTVRPRDAAIDLPREVYSSGVRRFVCEQLADRSVEHSCEALNTLGIDVPRRQAEQLAARLTQDFDVFYRERVRPANDTVTEDTLLVLSTDAKGVRMLPCALRDATRKAAERAARDTVRGDPMADRQARAHDRRMAVVTAIWDQDRCVRDAQDIVEQLKPPAQRHTPKASLPRPSNRTRTWPSPRCSPRPSGGTPTIAGRGWC